MKLTVSNGSSGTLFPIVDTGPEFRRSLLPIEIELELNKPFLALSISASDYFYINLVIVSARGEVTDASSYFLNSSFVTAGLLSNLLMLVVRGDVLTGYLLLN